MELQLNNSKRKKIAFSGSVSELMSRLKLRREEVVVKINGKVSPDDSKVSGNDKVEIIQVVFGG